MLKSLSRVFFISLKAAHSMRVQSSAGWATQREEEVEGNKTKAIALCVQQCANVSLFVCFQGHI